MLQPNDQFLFTRQRHEAVRAGMHYDIRLVHGDKAYSWATKKETPEPGKMIVLFEQPVHDASYALSSRIEIPEGQYGHGVTHLVEVQKATVHPDSKDGYIKFSTKDGRSFLLKKLEHNMYGDRAWLFKNISDSSKDSNKYIEKVADSKEKHGIRKHVAKFLGRVE